MYLGCLMALGFRWRTTARYKRRRRGRISPQCLDISANDDVVVSCQGAVVRELQSVGSGQLEEIGHFLFWKPQLQTHIRYFSFWSEDFNRSLAIFSFWSEDFKCSLAIFSFGGKNFKRIFATFSFGAKNSNADSLLFRLGAKTSNAPPGLHQFPGGNPFSYPRRKSSANSNGSVFKP